MEGEKKSFVKPLLAILAVILFVAGTGFGVWYWQQGEIKKQRTDSDAKITELQKQINDLKKNSTTNTTNSTTTTQNTENSTNTSSTEKVVQIPELAIKFTVPSSLSDLTYSFNQDNFQVGFSTSKLVNKGCKTENGAGPLGAILLLKPEGEKPYRFDLIKGVPGDGRNLYYQVQISGCSEDQIVYNLQSTSMSALKEALKTSVSITQ